MSFFEWIRDGVRRAVLLGVSDAVEDLGTPAGETGGEGSRQLLEFLRNGGSATTPAGRVTTRPKPKRLGRTLTETQAAQAKASS
jgi:hypothetical protein